MSTLIYIAAARAVDGGYEARFPDLENCVAAGADLAALLINARQALSARLTQIENAGEAWPAPTPVERVVTEPGSFSLPIDVTVDDPPIRVNVSLGERLVQRLDAAAEARGMTRSGFIARAVRVSLGEVGGSGEEFGMGARRIQDELSALGRRINESIGPESPFSRRMVELDERVFDGVRRAADTVSAAMGRRLDAARAAESSSAAHDEAR